MGLVKPLGLRYFCNTNMARVITLLLLRPNPLNRINTPVDTFAARLEKERKKKSEAVYTRKRIMLERKKEKMPTNCASFCLRHRPGKRKQLNKVEATVPDTKLTIERAHHTL